jgi:hypothetical protein
VCLQAPVFILAMEAVRPSWSVDDGAARSGLSASEMTPRSRVYARGFLLLWLPWLLPSHSSCCSTDAAGTPPWRGSVRTFEEPAHSVAVAPAAVKGGPVLTPVASVVASSRLAPPAVAGSQLVPPAVAGSQLAPPVVAGSRLAPPVVAGSRLAPPVVARSRLAPPAVAGSLVLPLASSALLLVMVAAGGAPSAPAPRYA